MRVNALLMLLSTSASAFHERGSWRIETVGRDTVRAQTDTQALYVLLHALRDKPPDGQIRIYHGGALLLEVN